jgi:hypothetical protein
MTVRQLVRALSDFDPKATVAIEGDSLVIGKGFTLTLPVAKKPAKREVAAPAEAPLEPNLFAEQKVS